MFPLLVGLLIFLAAVLIFIFIGGPKLPPDTDAIIDEVINSELPEMIVGETGFASSDGLSIWYERLSPEGSSKGVVLLLMGMGGNALFWPPKFMRGFLEAGYQVIRYDHRGTGMSDWVENWDRKNPYAVADMARDVVAVLDALQVERAHLVGLSMGGMVAQELAIQQPARTASLTLMMSSGFVGDPDLPSLSTRYFVGSAIKGLPLLKYRWLGGEKNLIKEIIAKHVAALGYNQLDVREQAEVVLYGLRRRRGINLRGAMQHFTAVTISGSRHEKLKLLNVPTLIIHGTADQMMPVEHGRKLAATIPNAKALWLEGLGHIFPVPDMAKLIKNITDHLEAADSAKSG
ncbi:MAG: alpha/beta hydrolase [Anaerolineaceae bacterium]|nr:alpha/beta hydrolase [Anaerolineaceae bacterium]